MNNINNNVLIIYGTRPEAIKLYPLYLSLLKSDDLKPVLCCTGQHHELLDGIKELFGVKDDICLKALVSGQSIDSLTSRLINELEKVVNETNPRFIVVQGDTTSAMVGAMIGFYHRKIVVHVEAGLRSGDKYQPFPEEINRSLISQMADIHFTPTEMATENLINSGINKNVFCVGNTIVDALLFLKPELLNVDLLSIDSRIDLQKKIILVTTHRRENIGQGLENICNSIILLKEKYPEIQFVLPVHYNPEVRAKIIEKLGKVNNVLLIEPLPYNKLLMLMANCYFILSDSGGIQEEAPSFKKPVLVLREKTERSEGITAGVAKLVGTNTELIVNESQKLITDKEYYCSMVKEGNPYGDGYACEKIKQIMTRYEG